MGERSSATRKYSPEEHPQEVELSIEEKKALLAEGDKILGIDEEPDIEKQPKKPRLRRELNTSERAAAELKIVEKTAREEKDESYRRFYNRAYFYKDFLTKLGRDGGVVDMEKLEQMGETLKQEDEASLLMLMRDLADKADIKLTTPEELSILEIPQRGALELPLELIQQLRDFNAAVKEFKIRKQAYNSLRSDVGKLHQKGGRLDFKLLMRQGLNHIEKELVDEWQKKDVFKNLEKKESLRAQTGAYNQLSRDLSELKFSPREKDLVDKGIVLLVDNKEKKALPQVELEKELPIVIIDQESSQAAADYERQKSQEEANKRKGIERLMALRKAALVKTQDKDIRKEIYNFNPEDYVRKTEKLFAIQNELLNLGALPGGSFGNTLKMFFKYPARYGEVAALQKEYSALSKEIKRQDETIENYLEIWEGEPRSAAAPERKDRLLPMERLKIEAERKEYPELDRQHIENLRKQKERSERLEPYRRDIENLRKQMEEVVRINPSLASEFNFSAEDYWDDYGKMARLRDSLEEECGFFVGASNLRNQWEARKRGKTKIYAELKKEYDNISEDLKEKDDVLSSYGNLTELKVVPEKKVRRKEGSIVERLKK